MALDAADAVEMQRNGRQGAKRNHGRPNSNLLFSLGAAMQNAAEQDASAVGNGVVLLP